MSLFVSTTYVVVMGVAALAAAIGAFAAPAGPMPLIALILCIYALHLVSVHDLQRRARHVSGNAARPAVSDRDQVAEAIARDREEAARELAEARRLREEAEQQWRLLRDMVQDRMRRSGGAPEPHTATVHSDVTLGEPVEGAAKDGAPSAAPRSQAAVRDRTTEETNGRIYGRW